MVKRLLLQILILGSLCLPNLAAVGGKNLPKLADLGAVVTQRWLGPDGNYLPFRNDAEILDFLKSARVVSTKYVGSGVTGAKKVRLEKDGIVINACFRDVHEDAFKQLLADGKYHYNFRDEGLFEVAAYELSRLLGLNAVPPAVERRIGGKRGSLQIWVEKAMTESKRVKKDVQPESGFQYYLQFQNMRFFDNLIYNEDRNKGNILVDRNWKVWLIDHTRAFRRWDSLNDPGRIQRVNRRLWGNLKNLDPELVRERLSPYLKPQEIDGLLKRRIVLLTRIDDIITRKGAERVLFSR